MLQVTAAFSESSRDWTLEKPCKMLDRMVSIIVFQPLPECTSWFNHVLMSSNKYWKCSWLNLWWIYLIPKFLVAVRPWELNPSWHTKQTWPSGCLGVFSAMVPGISGIFANLQARNLVFQLLEEWIFGVLELNPRLAVDFFGIIIKESDFGELVTWSLTFPTQKVFQKISPDPSSKYPFVERVNSLLNFWFLPT